jgi:hypothetical protein
MQLSHAEVGNRVKLQCAWLQNLFDVHTAAYELHQFLILKLLISQNLIQLSDDAKYCQHDYQCCFTTEGT